MPHDADYEIVAEHKGYQPQTLQDGMRKDADRNVVFHMEARGRRQEVNFWRGRNLVWAMTAAIVVFLSAGFAQAQDDAKHESQLRSVHGLVSEKRRIPCRAEWCS